ncbi:MAG: hypothetical protein IPJ71_19215 [Bdellovibrionales bacterium]|nr:hypothetical protein [Bdellovibrionales bacterium]
MAGKISANLATQKKLLARFRILWAALSAPQPMGAPKLAQAMALVAASFKGRMGENLAEAMRHMTANPSAQMGLAVATGLALGAAYPQELGAFLSRLDVTRTVLETVLGGVKILDIFL